MLTFYLNMALSDEERSIIDTVYKNYYDDMFRMAYKYVKNRDVAADIVHETMLKIINIFNEHGADKIQSLKTYVLVATKYTAIDHLHTDAKRNIIDDEDISERWDIIDDSPDPLDIIISNENFNKLLSDIWELPDTYRDTCYLKYKCDLDDRSIAAIIGISPATVAMRIHRGRKLLKKKISEVKALEK